MKVFIQNPVFVTSIGDIIWLFKNQVNNEENNDGEVKDAYYFMFYVLDDVHFGFIR